MRFDETPVLDARTARDILAALERRRASFVPEWQAGGGAGDALQRIVARYAQVVSDRVNQAADRALLAFLDMLGISLIPARPARAPIVFTTFAGVGNGQAPAGTRVGAAVPGAPSPLVFETEQTIGLAGARLTDVVTVWPDRDAYAEHTAEATGGRPFALFQPLTPVPHALYVAHDRVFDVAASSTIELAVELGRPGSGPLATIWEYWDGRIWQAFKDFDRADRAASQDGTAGFTRSGTMTLALTCGRPQKTSVAGIEARWIRGRTRDPLPPDPSRILPTIDRIRTRAVVEQRSDLPLDAAAAGAQQLDVTTTFYPFGITAVQGATFYFANDEAFGKTGARVAVVFNTFSQSTFGAYNVVLRWEYWNGDRWLALPGVPAKDFATTVAILFTVPADIASTEVSGETHVWLRVQLARGIYQFKNVIKVGTLSIESFVPGGPAIEHAKVNYRWRPPFQPLEHCVTHNDFRFERHDADVRSTGAFFEPFRPVSDATPTLYLGFDQPLPNDAIGLYLDVEETEVALPPLAWEAWDGDGWRALPVSDSTASLGRPGMVSLVAPAIAQRPRADLKSAAGTTIVTVGALQAAPFRAGQFVVVNELDRRESARVSAVVGAVLQLEAPLAGRYTTGSVTAAALPRFGTPRDWLRVRLEENGAPVPVAVNGIFLNAAWAVQTQTMSGEVLGSGNGQPGQTLFFSQFPILPGEVIEVRELEGGRASVELPMLRDELVADGFADDDIRTVTDPRSGRVREVWVRWRPQPHFFFSSATDRHYVVERARGRLLFGPRNPPVAVDNIRARTYRAGGGLVGNVPRGAINQLLGGAFAESVSNPRAASGGADGEAATGVKARGPETLRHRWRALSAKDFEAMAREASPGVAAVRVLPATAPNGRPAPGWVTVVIVPQAHDPRPQPSLELREQVHDYLVARSAGTLDPSHVVVIGPAYRPVGVAALVTPRLRGEAGIVARRLTAALERFLHPLTGGPEGRGWDFGRDVFLSDVAALLEASPGVDYVRQLDLLLDDIPAGPHIDVPVDRIVVAGQLRIEMEAGEA